MKSVYMVMHQRKPDVNELTKQIVLAFHKAGITVATEPWLYECIGEEAKSLFSGTDPDKCEAIMAVGGDGTLLRSNVLAVEYDLPLLGINVGTVGFLAEVELEQLEQACALLSKNEYTIEERMMLRAELDCQTVLALNDVVLSRGEYARLIGLNAWVDSDPVGRYIGDGLIASTPTGSTGYSLSAGGPIICPDVECMLITPICAHSLQHRPVVTSAGRKITIRLDNDCTQKAMVSVDGRMAFELAAGQTLEITRAKRYARFIKLAPRSFFSTIRIKLAEWSC